MRLPASLARLLGLGDDKKVSGVVQKAMDTLWEIAALYAVLLLLASTLFMWAEGCSFIHALYWAGITAPTVGYGDVTPKTGFGMFLSVIYAHVCVILVALFTTRLLMRVIEDQNAFTHDEQEAIKQDVAATNRKLDLLLERLDGAQLSRHTGTRKKK